MSAAQEIVSTVRAALAPHGIVPRGAVNFTEDETAPLLSTGDKAQSVLLLGNIGGSIFAPFSQWHSGRRDFGDPLDTWSKAMIVPLADTLGATAYFPSDPPWQPFQRWAMQAEGLKPSPLGILIHPIFGLWHGYRGALGLGMRLEPQPSSANGHPCDTCRDKPCLSRCPVGSVTAAGFDVASCRTHLRTASGWSGCMGGCLARSACPVGAAYRYPANQLSFHMNALKL